jgi:hypothetical protein
MNPINEVYKDKKLFRLKAESREELWDLCITNDISTEEYDKLKDFVNVAITRAYLIGEMR